MGLIVTTGISLYSTSIRNYGLLARASRRKNANTRIASAAEVATASILRSRLPHVKIVGFSALVRDAEIRDRLLATKNFDAVLSKLDGLDRLAEAVKLLLPDP